MALKCRPQEFHVRRTPLRFLNPTWKGCAFAPFHKCTGATKFRAVTRIAGHVHYLTDHAPLNVQTRWHQAWIRQHKRARWWKAGYNEIV